jgi:pimeloyl-ACP methyl ester carboxylesterase
MPLANYFVEKDPTLTVYLLDQRGTGLSSPITCKNPPVGSFNPYNASQVKSYDLCNQQIKETYGPILQYFDTFNAALDLKVVVDTIKPTTVSYFAQSYGTYLMNTFLQIPGIRANSGK